jgi:hypothetical protein
MILLLAIAEGDRWQTDHCPNIGHEISFGRFKAKVDRFCVFTDDDTTTGVVPPSEKEIIGSGCHQKARCKV